MDIKRSFSILTFQISDKHRYYIEQLHYYSVLLLVLVLPYWGAWKLMKALAFVIFFSSLFTAKGKIKAFFSNKVIIALFLFILLTYISSLWSPSETIFTWEFKWAVHRFQYYFLLIPGIYFSSLSKERIKNIFFLMALAPLGTAIIYYLNVFGLTDLSFSEFGAKDSSLLTNYLVNNFFLAYSAIYFLHLSLSSFLKKEYKQFTLFFILEMIFVSSMFINPQAYSRLALLVFIIIAMITPLFYLKRKYSMMLMVLSLLFIAVFMSTNTKIQNGLNEVKTAIEENRYTTSWGARLGLIIVGVDIFKEHPIMGRGISDVTTSLVVYKEKHPEYGLVDSLVHFHNEHVTLLVQVGVIGYLLYLLFIFLFLKTPISDPLIDKLKYTYTMAFLLMQMGEQYFLFYNTTFFICLFFIFIILHGEREKEN